jgi:two-component system alkaline phosphatase synthesis response regulator PhoP
VSTQGGTPGLPLTRGPQPVVLVVDDEESFVSSLRHTLSREGYRVLTAFDGPGALEIALREQPDVILLDLMLPGIHGLEVCRAIRSAPLKLQPGVIMVTAKSTDFDAVVGLESGADDYIAKPFNLNLLLARIRALMRRHRRVDDASGNGHPAEPAELTVGPLHLRPAAYEAAWDHHPLALSPRLFELLLHLARNVGRVVTRDELLNEVWGYDYAGQTRTVDVHVHWLRELLATAGDAGEMIQTVRGVGYKMVPPAQGGKGR